ncbi:MAG: biotin-dependent carboxyltransferase family protein [Bacillota bacterium]
MGFSVEKSGMMTTIQDSGRTGYRSIGMPVSGPMDTTAFRLANLLVKNEENTPALEVTMQGPVLHFTANTVIALCGADMNPTINHEQVSNNQPLHIAKGDVLRFGMPAKGMRVYISFHGGIKLNKQLGSCSTYTPAAIGGYHGRPLKAGDKIELNVREHSDRKVSWSASPSFFNYLQKREIRVIKSKQWKWFAEEAQSSFLSEEFTIQAESDRMGYRLHGPSLLTKEAQELSTEGIAKGSIQVPASGQPIILMADSQPTGGYPKIANIITADLPIIAQLKPHEKITFKEVSLEEAYQALRDFEDDMKLIRAGIRLKK